MGTDKGRGKRQGQRETTANRQKQPPIGFALCVGGRREINLIFGTPFCILQQADLLLPLGYWLFLLENMQPFHRVACMHVCMCVCMCHFREGELLCSVLRCAAALRRFLRVPFVSGGGPTQRLDQTTDNESGGYVKRKPVPRPLRFGSQKGQGAGSPSAHNKRVLLPRTFFFALCETTKVPRTSVCCCSLFPTRFYEVHIRNWLGHRDVFYGNSGESCPCAVSLQT